MLSDLPLRWPRRQVGFHKPHLPFVVPQRFVDLYPLDRVPLAPNMSAPAARSQTAPPASGLNGRQTQVLA